MHGWLFCNDTYRFFSLPTLGKDAVTKTDNKYIAHFLFLSYMSLYYGPMNIIRHLMISILSVVLRWRIFLHIVSSRNWNTKSCFNDYFDFLLRIVIVTFVNIWILFSPYVTKKMIFTCNRSMVKNFSIKKYMEIVFP